MATWFWPACEAVIAASSRADVQAAFRAGLDAAGYDRMAAGEIDIDNPRRSTMIVNDWPQAWFEIYQAENLIDDDPLVMHLRGGAGPFAWTDLKRLEGRTRWAIDAARGFGWVDGLVVPLRRAGASHFGLVSLTRREPVPEGEERRAAIVFAALGYERLRHLSGGLASTAAGANLTPRELACLDLAAQGLSDSGIAERLGIAAGTVHDHVERSKRKLGARTRTEAVAAVTTLGIIPLAPNQAERAGKIARAPPE